MNYVAGIVADIRAGFTSVHDVFRAVNKRALPSLTSVEASEHMSVSVSKPYQPWQ